MASAATSAIVAKLFPEHYPVHLLHHTEISAIAIPHQIIACFYVGTQISLALETLSRNNIISAPVVTDDGKLFGFVDMLDIVALFEHCKNSKIAIEEFFKTQVEKAMELPLSLEIPILNGVPRHPVIALPHSTSMAMLLERMTRGSSLHRVAMSKDGKITAIISQRDILRWIVKNLNAFEHESLIYNVNKTLAELGFGGPSDRKIETVTEGTFTLDAFARMRNCNVSSFAVVNDSGALTHVLSASDLRSLSVSNINLLELPLRFFLNKRPATPLITATLDDRLGDVLRNLDHSGKHRIVLVDKHMKPLLMITLSDLIPLFAVMAQK